MERWYQLFLFSVCLIYGMAADCVCCLCPAVGYCIWECAGVKRHKRINPAEGTLQDLYCERLRNSN